MWTNHPTKSEDNLILRGRNLFGEKSWEEVSRRFFPPMQEIRSLYHRHDTLTCLIMERNGVDLITEPKYAPRSTKSSSNNCGNTNNVNNTLKGKDSLNPTAASIFEETQLQYGLQRVRLPDTYGLSRWSIQEDVMLMKAANIVVI